MELLYNPQPRLLAAVPAAAEKIYFAAADEACEVGYAVNTDGTVTASLRLPFAAGADPKDIASVRAIFTGLTVSNVSYSYVDAAGNTTPITAASLGAASPAAAYLQIAFTAESLEAFKGGALDKVFFRLKSDTDEYVQTFLGGLKFTDMTPTDETPGGSSDGGCDAGAFGLLGLAAAAAILRKKGK